jgi:hypothetical protein
MPSDKWLIRMGDALSAFLWLIIISIFLIIFLLWAGVSYF